MKVNKSKSEMVLRDLRRGFSITQFHAFSRYNTIRLGAIIYSLRKRGWEIDTIIEEKKYHSGCVTRYARYRMPKTPNNIRMSEEMEAKEAK